MTIKPITATNSTGAAAVSAVEDFTERAAGKAESAIEATRSAANNALDSIQSGVDDLREAAPSLFSRTASQVEELTRRGVERARSAGAQVKEQATRAGDRTVMLIKDEPVKSVLIAAATGAAVAALVSWLVRSRRED